MASEPQTAEALNKRAIELSNQGQFAEAAIYCRRVLALRPGDPAAHNNLGAVLEKQDCFDEAADSYRQALQLMPGFATGYYNLGNVLERLGRLDEAVASLRRALELAGEHPEIYNKLGLALSSQGNLDQAEAVFRRRIELEPHSAAAHHNLGNVLEKQDRLDEAMECYTRALALMPDNADAYNNLGNTLTRLGRIDEAMTCYRRALKADPNSAVNHSNMLLAMQYSAGVTPSELHAAHWPYDICHAAALRSTWRPHDNNRDPDRRLRLGFVSADFGFHPVGYFLVRVLEHLDAAQVEIVCYSDGLRGDAMTARIRSAAHQWHDVRPLNHQQLADRIRADRIDVAFDLSGHMSNNRLLTFARKPAPIQITWMGYVGTTGLAAMDYLLADRYEVPEGSEAHIRERVLHMPDGYVCYDPPVDAPPVSSLPALAQGHVTFGSFNYLAKINPPVIETWARILRRVGGARLVLKYAGLNTPSAHQRIAELFAAQGVESARLDLLGFSPHAELLREYQRVDVALDPFPYSGGLTTCEALWMGVPVVTCPGETFAGRHSLSHLSNVGLRETIAADLDAYVEIAAALAGDLPRLAAIRARLRDQMAASPLCDGKRFADNLMDVLGGAWREWCAPASPTDSIR